MPGLKYINILCIDDNENNLFTLSSLLKTIPNINPIEAISGEDGLKILLKEKIDLVLLDIQMPDMNGFEVAKLIKSNKKTKDIPIVFVTAVFKQDEFIKEGFDIGAVDYITKPIDDKQFLNKIMLYIKLFEKNHQLQESNKRFYSIAQSIANGIYVLDLELKTTFINKRALELLGYSSKELLGKKIHNYIHYKDKNEEPILESRCPIHSAMFKDSVYKNDDTVLVKKNGELLPVSIVATPLEENEKVIGTVVYFKDRSSEIKIEQLKNSIIQDQIQFINSLVDMIEARDSYTAGHTKRVAEYCELIAKEMNYSENDINTLNKAAMLHDIGKISTPDSILLKPGRLNDLEYRLIQEHVTSGYNILSKIDSYKEIADIMYQHHERYDGSGYPQGLKGDEIGALSRIMMVADSFDAMTTNRIYKPRKSVDEALEEIKSLSGKFYHPEVVAASLKALKYVSTKENISQLPTNELEKERFRYFYKDKLTGVYDIDYIYIMLMYYTIKQKVYLYLVSLQNFSKFNETYGWEGGDNFLKSFANYLRTLFRNTFTFRLKGDNFLILSEIKISNFAQKVEKYKGFEKYSDIVNFSWEEKVIKDKDDFIKNYRLSEILHSSIV